MATTTNYGWETPDDTDLVKDGASAIRTLGSSIDTTTKALNPSTTLGDIEYRSSTANTNSRLGIGSTGQVLTVSGGVPTWATPAGSSGPAFRATGTTNQSLTSSTDTKAQFGTETFDTDNCYDSTTNYRFTPNKSGYYQFTGQARITAGTSGYYQISIYKNGSSDSLLTIVTSAPGGTTMNGSNLIYMNGTTDYVEFYVYHGGTDLNLDRSNSFFAGAWIRS